MASTNKTIQTGNRSLRRQFFLVMLYSFFCIAVNAQCPTPATPFPDIFCTSSNIAVGTGIEAGSTYNWYVNGAFSHGPVTIGDGDSKSFNYTISSPANNGAYTIVQDKPGCPLTEIFVHNVVYLNDVTGLSTTAITASSVSFTWANQAAGAVYEYAVLPTSTPPSAGIETTSNAATVSGLSGSTTYFIHVRPGCSDATWTTLQFNTLAGTCFAIAGDLKGGGNYCSGASVLLSIDQTLSYQQYTWLRNAVPVNGPVTGNGSTLNYNFAISSAAQAGTYTISATRAGCTTTTFGSVNVSLLSTVTGLVASGGPTSVYYQWNPVAQSNVSSSTLYQYFISTSGTPPASGNIAFGTSGSATTTSAGAGLINGATYFLHVRAECKSSPNGFGAWATVSFVPGPVTAPNCASFTNLSLCTPVTASIPLGAGAWNFSGTYPVNSVGQSTDGKELGYTFTPATTAVYYLHVTSASGSSVGYFYKPVSGGCSSTGWTGIKGVFEPGKYSIGMLQAGIQYYILLDNTGNFSNSQTFKICRAVVASPAVFNTCLPTSFSLPFTMVPNSTKEEFILDTAGNLIASLDFSNVGSSLGNVSVSYYVNNGATRRDVNNKEFLDRNITITTGNTPANPLGVKVFFTNAELQKLIDEPNDGLADVTGIADLKITRTQGKCGEGIGFGSLLSQATNGSYDGTSGFVKFNTPGFSTFYLHGGVASLDADDKTNCPGATTSLVIAPAGSGFTYQWQVDQGSGFVNIVNNASYSGATTTALNLLNPPSSFYGYRYRAVATNGGTIITSSAKKIKFSATWNGNTNNAWQNGANWDCGVVPDANTDVIIPPGVPNAPVISNNDNVSCRSILASPLSAITVNTGGKLNVTGK